MGFFAALMSHITVPIMYNLSQNIKIIKLVVNIAKVVVEV